jgi:transcriptional antiterminator NusG
MQNWCVLFVKTGKEFKVERQLKDKFYDERFCPFVPMIEVIMRIGGQNKKEIRPMFPGYVFIESDVSNYDFMKSTSKFIYTSNDIIGLMKYPGVDNIIYMSNHEQSTLQKFFNNDFCVESSTGIIVGDKICIKSGPLIGFESQIRKIDRHKRAAWIDMELFGERRPVWVSLEIVEKIAV